MINGKFDEPDDLPGTQMVDGKYTLAPLHLLKLNPEVVTSVGVVSGEKIPVITDRNPHLEVRTWGVTCRTWRTATAASTFPTLMKQTWWQNSLTRPDSSSLLRWWGFCSC